MSKKEKTHVTGSLTIKGTFSQLRDPVDKKTVRSRGPGQIGQSKPSATVRLGRIGVIELKKRFDLAVRVLETGKGPAKGEDANLEKLKQCQEALKKSQEGLREVQADVRTLLDQVEKMQAERDEIIKSAFNENSKSSEKEVKGDGEGSNSSLEEKLKDAADPAPETLETKETAEEPQGDPPADDSAIHGGGK